MAKEVPTLAAVAWASRHLRIFLARSYNLGRWAGGTLLDPCFSRLMGTPRHLTCRFFSVLPGNCNFLTHCTIFSPLFLCLYGISFQYFHSCFSAGLPFTVSG